MYSLNVYFKSKKVFEISDLFRKMMKTTEAFSGLREKLELY